MERGFVLRPGGGRSIDLGRFQMSLMASVEDTASAFSVLEADEPPNFGPPMHTLNDCAEAFYVMRSPVETSRTPWPTSWWAAP
jgi:hypothetical protein